MTRVRIGAIVLIVAVMLVLAGCGGDKDNEDNNHKSTTTTDKPVIKLAYMSWLSAQANTAVAKILLEEQLGYQVEIVPLTVDEQWEALAQGTVHAQLEVWSNNLADNVNQYIDQDKTVEYGGDLGVVGQSGWYVPFYLVSQYPALTTWEGFKDPEIVALFATSETGGQGRLLSGDPTWLQSQYTAAIVKNLGLDLQVVYTGSEDNLLAALKPAYENQEPILIDFWSPHWALAIYDLFQIQLPPYSEECYAVLDQAACAFPSNTIIKVIWPGLKDYAPDAYLFFKNFKYSSLDQIKIMAQVQIEHKTLEEAARMWIDSSEAVWKPWLE